MLHGLNTCSSLKQLVATSVGMGSTALQALTPLLATLHPQFNPERIVLSTTGARDQRKYTLDSGACQLDMSASCVGPEDLLFISALVLNRSSLLAMVRSFCLAGNKGIAGFRVADGSTTQWDSKSRDSDLRGLVELGRAVSSWQTLEQLDVSGCGLGIQALVQLIGGIDWASTRLKDLNVGSNWAVESAKHPAVFAKICSLLASAKLDHLCLRSLGIESGELLILVDTTLGGNFNQEMATAKVEAAIAEECKFCERKADAESRLSDAMAKEVAAVLSADKAAAAAEAFALREVLDAAVVQLDLAQQWTSHVKHRLATGAGLGSYIQALDLSGNPVAGEGYLTDVSTAVIAATRSETMMQLVGGTTPPRAQCSNLGRSRDGRHQIDNCSSKHTGLVTPASVNGSGKMYDEDGKRIVQTGTALDGLSALGQAVGGVLPCLTWLDLSDCQLTAASLQAFCGTSAFNWSSSPLVTLILAQNPSLAGLQRKKGSKLEWADESRDSDLGGMALLSQVVSQTSTLTRLDLSSCGLGPAALATLCQGHWNAAPLRDLSLRDNPLSGTRVQGTGSNQTVTLDRDLSGLQVLAGQLLSAGSQLEHLSLFNCQLGPAAIAALVAVAEWRGSALRSVNLLRNPIEAGGLAALVAAVQASPVESVTGLRANQPREHGKLSSDQEFIHGGALHEKPRGHDLEKQDSSRLLHLDVADYQGQKLGPGDLQLICADLYLRRATAGLKTLRLADNPGLVGKVENGVMMNVDHHLQGFGSACAVLAAAGFVSADAVASAQN
eukprot:SAG31_NODE_157_length_22047_cov_5.897849_7_plen_782_part_00